MHIPTGTQVGRLYNALIDEEHLYLETVAYRLREMGYPAVVENRTSLSYNNPILTVTGRDDFNVWTGGEESDFKLQICGELGNTRRDMTFIDIPWGRPVTAAYIIHRYIEDNPQDVNGGE